MRYVGDHIAVVIAESLEAAQAASEKIVIDLDNLAIDLPEYKHDFPGGAGRYVQTGRGYDFVLVNGQVFMESGEHSGALSGQILRS